MKKSALFFVLIFSWMAMGTANTKAQTDNRHELRAQITDGYPAGIVMALFFGVMESFENLAGYQADELETSQLFGNYSFIYRYRIIDRLSVGIDFSHQAFSRKYLLTRPGQPQAVGSKSLNFTMIMPSAEFRYVNLKYFQMYGNAAAGLMTMMYKESTDAGTMPVKGASNGFGFQINPLGMRFGSKFGGYVEVGAGFRGFFTAGISLTL